ncbi:hypothetical protein BRADI_1g08436v3, partial [Brachypodium distachyon]
MYTSLPPSAGRVRSCNLKKQAATRMILLLYLIIQFVAVSAQQENCDCWEKQYCMVDKQTPDDSWAFGPGGAGCTVIGPNKS